MSTRPKILSIAGFDPSSGAGLTSDLKTFESLRCYGLSICTANTIQSDSVFKECLWQDLEVMKKQLRLLSENHSFDFVKVGIVENWKVLSSLVDEVLRINPRCKIIVDPVLKASSDFNFHNSDDSEFLNLLDKIYLLTPNYDEIKSLFANKTVEETIALIQSKTNLYLKGGHRVDVKGKDELHLKNGKSFSFKPKEKLVYEKHGSGCVLASSITSYLALGFSLFKASVRGKGYTERFLASNKTLLGYHR